MGLVDLCDHIVTLCDTNLKDCVACMTQTYTGLLDVQAVVLCGQYMPPSVNNPMSCGCIIKDCWITAIACKKEKQTGAELGQAQTKIG